MIEAKADIPVQRLRQLLSYDPITGHLTWKYRPEGPNKWNNKWAGKIAGTHSVRGYIVVAYGRKLYGAHRLAWAITTGEWPESFIDHRNTIKTDNRLSNLRLATLHQNAQNRTRCSANTSGYKGVYWHGSMRKWGAETRKNGVKYRLGYFSDPSEAHKAYETKVRELFGEYARAQ